MSKPGRHTLAKEKKQRKQLHLAIKIANGKGGGPDFRKAAKKAGWKT